LVFILAILISLPSSSAQALSKRYAASVKAQYRWMILFAPPYNNSPLIKPKDPIKSGVDCSRYKYLVYWWAAVIGPDGQSPHRVTAADMAAGKGGWEGIDIPLDDADELDLVWWSFKTKHDHVGTIWLVKGLRHVTHASYGKKKIAVDAIRGTLLTKMVKARRIMLGEKKRR
jgi:hypothetical protein